MRGVHPLCPAHILTKLNLLTLTYFGFDGLLHQGQILVDERLTEDLNEGFQILRQTQFPLQSLIPLSHPEFNWQDQKSMELNNSSGFNYRHIQGSNKLSCHAFGLAIDLNPMQNPYQKGGLSQPASGVYNEEAQGTLLPDHPFVIFLKQRGWEWGGDWVSCKDWQHFQKAFDLAELET